MSRMLQVPEDFACSTFTCCTSTSSTEEQDNQLQVGTCTWVTCACLVSLLLITICKRHGVSVWYIQYIFSNFHQRFMKTPERLTALRKAKQALRNRDRRLSRMKKRLEALTSDCGVELENEVQEEITEVIDRHGTDMESLPISDFRRIFWDQQVVTHFDSIWYIYFETYC